MAGMGGKIKMQVGPSREPSLQTWLLSNSGMEMLEKSRACCLFQTFLNSHLWCNLTRGRLAALSHALMPLLWGIPEE